MPKAEIEKTLSVSKEKLFRAITDYQSYTDFVEGVKSVELKGDVDGKKRVTYHVSMMKDVVYTLDHFEDLNQGIVSWTLVESEAFKVNSGRWEIHAISDSSCKVKYELELEFNFPVPGFILKGLIKGSLPKMVESFARRAQSL